MKYLSKVLLFALVFMLCVGPAMAGAEGSLLADRMERAYESGRDVEAAFSAKLGDGLALFIPQQTYDAVQQLLADALIKVHWARGENDRPVMGVSLIIQDVELITGTARPQADGMAIETSLLPGKTVLLPLDSLGALAEQQTLPVQIDEEMVALFVQAYETYLGIASEWAVQTDGMFVSDEIEKAATDVRDTVVRSDQLRVNAAQLKDLLVRLTDAFEQDAQLQSALASYLTASGNSEVSMPEIAKALSDGVRSLTPLDGTLKLDMYTGADMEPVGLDFEVEPMFEGAPQTAFAKYDRLDGDDRVSRGFQGRIGFGDGGMAAAKLDYSAQESHVEPISSSDLLLRGMFQPTGEDPISQVTLTDKRQTALDDGQERLTDVIELVVESLTPDGAQPAEGAMPMNAVISTQSVTNERADDDFDSDISVSLQALGMEFAVLELKLESGPFEPADTSGNALFYLSDASAEDQAALVQELQSGLGLAVMNAMAVLPPELLQMMQGA